MYKQWAFECYLENAEKVLKYKIMESDLRKLVEEAKEECDSADAVWLVYKIEKLLEGE